MLEISSCMKLRSELDNVDKGDLRIRKDIDDRAYARLSMSFCMGAVQRKPLPVSMIIEEYV